MKNKILPCLLCVIFLLFSTSVGEVFAFYPEHIEFVYQGKVFDYELENNIKTSSVFDVEYEINKYNRFGSTEDRIKLLKQMLNLGFDKSVALEYLFPNINKKIDSISKNINIFLFVYNLLTIL